MAEIEIERSQIDLIITAISPNGEVTIQFSEKLLSITDFEEQSMNMTVFNILRHSIMEVNYYCNVQADDSVKLGS